MTKQTRDRQVSTPLEVKEDWARSGARTLPLYELEPSNAELMRVLIGNDEDPDDETPDVLDFIEQGRGR